VSIFSASPCAGCVGTGYVNNPGFGNAAGMQFLTLLVLFLLALKSPNSIDFNEKQISFQHLHVLAVLALALLVAQDLAMQPVSQYLLS
jgi:hypothetical protein